MALTNLTDPILLGTLGNYPIFSNEGALGMRGTTSPDSQPKEEQQLTPTEKALVLKSRSDFVPITLDLSGKAQRAIYRWDGNLDLQFVFGIHVSPTHEEEVTHTVPLDTAWLASEYWHADSELPARYKSTPHSIVVRHLDVDPMLVLFSEEELYSTREIIMNNLTASLKPQVQYTPEFDRHTHAIDSTRWLGVGNNTYGTTAAEITARQSAAERAAQQMANQIDEDLYNKMYPDNTAGGLLSGLRNKLKR